MRTALILAALATAAAFFLAKVVSEVLAPVVAAV